MTPRLFTNLAAPAKLNLFLHIVGRRSDGYHLLESVFVLIDLKDSVTVERLENSQILRTGDTIGDPELDLCVKAARLLARETDCRLGARIHVTKHIPAGAGLGGGSSDASTTLMALNRLWALNLPREKLLDLGACLGADVPFFLFGQSALAGGIGNILTPIHIPDAFAAVLMPPTPTSTQAIYQAADLKRDTIPVSKEAVETDIKKTWPRLFGTNDMQPVAVRLNPQIGRALEALGPESRMTGSGSAVFILKSNRESANKALLQIPPAFTGYVAKILHYHPLYRESVG